MVQSLAALVSLVLALIVVAVALVVVRRASRRDPAGYANVYRVRRYYAIGLIGALAVLLVLVLAMAWLVPKLFRFVRRLFDRLAGLGGVRTGMTGGAGDLERKA